MFPPNCPTCGHALVPWSALLAAAAIVSLSKAAGAQRIAEQLEHEARRRRDQEEESREDPQHQA